MFSIVDIPPKLFLLLSLSDHLIDVHKGLGLKISFLINFLARSLSDAGKILHGLELILTIV